MTERVDYSWDDQDPEQMQSWHETLGSDLNPEIEELPDALTTRLREENVGLDDSDQQARALLLAFDEWLNENFSIEEVDIILGMPVDSIWSPVGAKHPDVMRLMNTHELDFESLRERNLELRVEVYAALKRDNLDHVFPWTIESQMSNEYHFDRHNRKKKSDGSNGSQASK